MLICLINPAVIPELNKNDKATSLKQKNRLLHVYHNLIRRYYVIFANSNVTKI